jgi:hypothetical protein
VQRHSFSLVPLPKYEIGVSKRKREKERKKNKKCKEKF